MGGKAVGIVPIVRRVEIAKTIRVLALKEAEFIRFLKVAKVLDDGRLDAKASREVFIGPAMQLFISGKGVAHDILIIAELQQMGVGHR